LTRHGQVGDADTLGRHVEFGGRPRPRRTVSTSSTFAPANLLREASNWAARVGAIHLLLSEHQEVTARASARCGLATVRLRPGGRCPSASILTRAALNVKYFR
jgi:hypothetical protein